MHKYLYYINSKNDLVLRLVMDSYNAIIFRWHYSEISNTYATTPTVGSDPFSIAKYPQLFSKEIDYHSPRKLLESLEEKFEPITEGIEVYETYLYIKKVLSL